DAGDRDLLRRPRTQHDLLGGGGRHEAWHEHAELGLDRLIVEVPHPKRAEGLARVSLVEGGVDVVRFGFLDPDLRRIEVERKAEAEMTRASERRMVHIGVIEAHDVPANARSSGPGGAVRVAPVILNSRPERERVDWAELRAHVE